MELVFVPPFLRYFFPFFSYALLCSVFFFFLLFANLRFKSGDIAACPATPCELRAFLKRPALERSFGFVRVSSTVLVTRTASLPYLFPRRRSVAAASGVPLCAPNEITNEVAYYTTLPRDPPRIVTVPFAADRILAGGVAMGGTRTRSTGCAGRANFIASVGIGWRLLRCAAEMS